MSVRLFVVPELDDSEAEGVEEVDIDEMSLTELLSEIIALALVSVGNGLDPQSG